MGAGRVGVANCPTFLSESTPKGANMSSAVKRFVKITLESVFRGIIIALIIIFAKRLGWI